MKTRIFGSLVVMAALIASISLYSNHAASASDHQDSPATLARPGADITDPYIFPAPDNSQNVVIGMDVHPLIPTGQGLSTYFDPQVIYQMNFDGTDENVTTPSKTITRNIVIQFTAGSPGSNQPIYVYGLGHPSIDGSKTQLVAQAGQGTINSTFTAGNMKVFAGAREDPFFFDLAQFLKILPDRNKGSDAQSCLPKIGNDSCPQGFNNPGSDTLAGYNVLSFIVEMPRSALIAACGGPKIAFWVTTHTASGS